MITPVTPPKSLLRQVGRAIGDYGLIRDGDRVLLGLSGGKDSLSLLHLLLHFQRRAPIRFAVGAVTVDPQSDSFDPSVLIPYMEALGV
ncbi:MAG: tRNA 2-thiocytidine biosynthesis protein TtcA, partial [Gammaproteobacteria bacterium]|nr:tRNA 2-thiocytidine biosynthesis protein TtcA [Gammaproteobacteria bacterium]MDX5374263.1 tRNA 2-thiocytidine biosynthesis protein TtcA [Gammaproteobacteria bacterium]